MRTPDLFGDARKTTFNGLYAADVDPSLNGQTCKDCRHCIRKVCSRSYHKCALMRHKWTFTAKTDVCLTRSACSRFQSKED